MLIYDTHIQYMEYTSEVMRPFPIASFITDHVMTGLVRARNVYTITLYISYKGAACWSFLSRFDGRCPSFAVRSSATN